MSLSHALVQTRWLSPGHIEGADGSLFRCFEFEPLSSGLFEDELNGQIADGFFQKLSDLIARLPNFVEGQFILFRKLDVEGALVTTLMAFERVDKESSYSHLGAILNELHLKAALLKDESWRKYLELLLGPKIKADGLPDVVWEKNSIKAEDKRFESCL